MSWFSAPRAVSGVCGAQYVLLLETQLLTQCRPGEGAYFAVRVGPSLPGRGPSWSINLIGGTIAMGNPAWGAGRHAGLDQGRKQGIAVGLALGTALGSGVLWGYNMAKERWGRRSGTDAPAADRVEPLATESSAMNNAAENVEPTSGESSGEADPRV